MPLTVAVIVCVAATRLSAQPLPALTDSLLARHPGLKALRYEVAAFAKTAEAAAQLPDLEAGAGFGALPVETRLGPQVLRVGATQALPWPGVLAARGRVAAAQAQPAVERAAALALDLRYRLAEAYYALAADRARLSALDSSRVLYAALERTALSRVEAGSGSSVDVYRVALARERLGGRLDGLAAELRGPLARVNALLGRAPLAPVRTPSPEALLTDTLALPSLPAVDEVLTADHPVLRVFAARQAVAQARSELIGLEARPDFAVGLDYILTGRRDDANPERNGRDAVVPRVGVRIPLSRAPYAARREAEALNALQFAAELQAAREHLLAEAGGAYAALASARVQLSTLTRQRELLAATLRVATVEYAEGRRGFDELLRLNNDLVELRLGVIGARRQLLTARARLTKLLAL